MFSPEAILVGALMGTFILGFILGFGAGQAVGKAQTEARILREEYNLPGDSGDDDGNKPRGKLKEE